MLILQVTNENEQPFGSGVEGLCIFIISVEIGNWKNLHTFYAFCWEKYTVSDAFCEVNKRE